jgi:AcrR family transcriptional regulator
MEVAARQTDEAVKDTKAHILSVARQLFSEYSYLGVSMQDIAEKMRMTKAALYYHFKGKAEVYEGVLDEVFEALSLSIAQALSERTTDRKLRMLIKSYLDFGSKEKNLIKALMLKLSKSDSRITRHIIRLRERSIRSIQPVVEEMIIGKKLVGRVDGRLLASLLTGMMDGLLLEYSLLNKKIDSEKISDQMISALF